MGDKNLESSAKPRRFCIAVDDSACSGQAVNWTTDKLLQPTDEVHLVNVVRPVPTGAETGDGWELSGGAWSEPPKEILHDADELLNKYSQQIRQQVGTDNVRVDRVTGVMPGAQGVGLALTEYAAEHNVDAVILGSRCLSGVSSAVLGAFGLGSVGDYCVKNLPCSVIVHKPKSADADT